MIEFFEATLLGNVLSMLIVWCLVLLRVKLAKRHFKGKMLYEKIGSISDSFKAAGTTTAILTVFGFLYAQFGFVITLACYIADTVLKAVIQKLLK